MSAQKGRDAVRPPQTHPETRSAAITRPERRPRRIPPRRHRPKPPQARHADPNANADLSNLRRRAAHEHGRDRRSPPPQYFKTDFFNGIAPFRTLILSTCCTKQGAQRTFHTGLTVALARSSLKRHQRGRQILEAALTSRLIYVTVNRRTGDARCLLPSTMSSTSFSDAGAAKFFTPGQRSTFSTTLNWARIARP